MLRCLCVCCDMYVVWLINFQMSWENQKQNCCKELNGVFEDSNSDSDVFDVVIFFHRFNILVTFWFWNPDKFWILVSYTFIVRIWIWIWSGFSIFVDFFGRNLQEFEWNLPEFWNLMIRAKIRRNLSLEEYHFHLRNARFCRITLLKRHHTPIRNRIGEQRKERYATVR